MDKYKKDPQAVTVTDLALRATEGQGPALVRFINTADVEGTKDKVLLKVVQDSKNIVDLFKFTNQDVCMTARHFRLLSVSTDELDPKTSPVVNRCTAPAVVVIDAAGKPVKALTGNLRSADLLAAMGQAIKSQVPLEKLLTVERRILKEVLDLDNLRASLDAKRKALDTAKGPQTRKLEGEIAALEAKVEEAQARIRVEEGTLQPAG